MTNKDFFISQENYEKVHHLSSLEDDFYELLHGCCKPSKGTLISSKLPNEKIIVNEENIFNIITDSFDKNKFVVMLPTNYYDKSDLLIVACCNKVLMHNPYEIGSFPGTYKPNIEVTNKDSISDILNEKTLAVNSNLHQTEYKYKSYEYLASYLYHNKDNIDCYSVGLLYDRISNEDKLLCNVNLNYLSAMIKDAVKFELVHNVINKTNIFRNKCFTPSGSGILMMIFENNANEECINDYIKMFINTDESIKDTANSINKMDNYGKNIFSYCNFECLLVESYKSIISLGYDVNNKYMKNGEETNIIFDLVNCIEQIIDNYADLPKDTSKVEKLNFSLCDFESINDMFTKSTNVTKNTICDGIRNQIEGLKYLLTLQSLENSTLAFSGTHIVFKLIDIICKIINKLSTTTINTFMNDKYKYCIKQLNEIICNLLNNSEFDLNYVDNSNESILSNLIIKAYQTTDNKNIGAYCKQLIKKLLKHDNIDTNHRNDNNKIPLEYVIENCDTMMFDLLRNYSKTNLSTLTKHGHPIAFLFVDLLKDNKKQHINMFIDLLKMDKFNHTDVTHDGQNLLIYLCNSGIHDVSSRLINTIIDTGIDINKCDNKGYLALDYVTINKQWLFKDILEKKCVA